MTMEQSLQNFRTTCNATVMIVVVSDVKQLLIEADCAMAELQFVLLRGEAVTVALADY